MSYNFRQLKRDSNPQSKRRPYLSLRGDHWGKNAWGFLYNVVLGYEGDIEDLREFIKQFKFIMPCPHCREHFSDVLTKEEIPTTIAEIFDWLTNLENRIAKEKYNTAWKFIDRYGQIEKTSRFQYRTNDETGEIEEIKKPCPSCGQASVSRMDRGVTAAHIGIPSLGRDMNRRRLGSVRGMRLGRQIGGFGMF